MLPRGIQTKISLVLLGLLLIAMVLVDLVLLMVLQSQLISLEGRKVESALQRFKKKNETVLISKKFNEDDLQRLLDLVFVEDLPYCASVLIEKKYFSKGSCPLSYILKQTVQKAVRDDQTQQMMTGKGWAVFRKSAQFISIAIPVKANDQKIGGIGVMFPISPIYSTLRGSQKIFVFYLLVNAVLLSLGGYYLIARIFMRPIKRLVARAEQYDARIYDKDEDLLFSVRLEDGELNKLSLALNQMMDRISKDRETLRENVMALKKVNLELKQAQKEVIRAEKLASVGRLSAGIAHEIGNPIGIILGYLELLKSKDLSPEEQGEYLSRAESEILRINTIIRQLLNLSRPIKGEPAVFSIHSFIKELIETVRVQPLLTETSITIETNADQDNVLADPDHFRQVCLNILINAADAIKSSPDAGNGLIQIKTGQKEHNGRLMIEIQIADNGIGIAEAELENIFDPFFTTKEPGKGTGLGLSVSLTIIEQMGGTLAARPRDENGTSIIICLPVVEKKI